MNKLAIGEFNRESRRMARGWTRILATKETEKGKRESGRRVGERLSSLCRVRVDIQADFWNGDPDVDALCRIAYAPECTFDPSSFPFAANKPGPFDSQNTFIGGELLKDYFVFPHVGRMDDIWPSYYVQALGYRVVYNRPSVYQARNAHDLTRDMRNEYLGYENNLKLIGDLANDPENILGHIPGRTALAFKLYRRHFERRAGSGEKTHS